MQEKCHNVLFQTRWNLDFGHYMSAVYVQSFRLIQWTIAFLFKFGFKTAQMCQLFVSITFHFQNCALSSNNSMVFFHCNSYCKMDSAIRIFKLSAISRNVYVLGNVLVTYNLMLITLAYVSSTIPWKGQQSQRIFVLIFVLSFTRCNVLYSPTLILHFHKLFP